MAGADCAAQDPRPVAGAAPRAVADAHFRCTPVEQPRLRRRQRRHRRIRTGRPSSSGASRCGISRSSSSSASRRRRSPPRSSSSSRRSAAAYCPDARPHGRRDVCGSLPPTGSPALNGRAGQGDPDPPALSVRTALRDPKPRREAARHQRLVRAADSRRVAVWRSRRDTARPAYHDLEFRYRHSARDREGSDSRKRCRVSAARLL